MALIFDAEANGYLDTVTKMHNLVIKDTSDQSVIVCRQNGNKAGYHDIEEGLFLLQSSDIIVAHNGIKYDLPVIQKLYPWFKLDETKVIDTLVLARLIYADLSDVDTKLIIKKKLDKDLFRSHSLKAWGQRLGNRKAEYTGGFDEWSQDMEDYCVQDVSTLETLYDFLMSKSYSQESIALEHGVAFICAQMERNGFCFDTDNAWKLYSELVKRKLVLEAELQKVFPPWYARVSTVVPKVNNKTTGITKDVKYTKVVQKLFNPSSRDHIADRLITLRGWKPDEKTETGKPKVDEQVLEKLPYPEAKPLTEYLMVSKRIGQLAEGDRAWLKEVKQDGKIHGSVNTNGAVTGRATHSYPNVGQVPSANSPYGHECRSLFTARQGYVLVGADLSGLELRCLAHYMGKYDGGEYGRVLLTGDIHTANQIAAGLDTRPQAKTFIYAFLYGAGVEKIGSIVGGTSTDGARLKKRFLAQTPALKTLIEKVTKAAESGFLPGLDGRKLTVRSPHAALNTLLQSAGALIAKRALVELRVLLIQHGIADRVGLVAWVHDEFQLECDPAVADLLGSLCVKSFELAGEHFNFRCPITGEYKVGKTWADTH